MLNCSCCKSFDLQGCDMLHLERPQFGLQRLARQTMLCDLLGVLAKVKAMLHAFGKEFGVRVEVS